MEPLFIFMDLEAAHGDVYFGDIIEISAQVDPRVMKNEVFDRLVNTKQNLAYFTLEVCKITRNMLNGKEYFPDVFCDFMCWIDDVLKKCSTKEHKTFYPVLVAHGGFDMDFMMIQSNMERNEMNLDILIEHNLHFADTYYFLKKMRLDGRVSYLAGSKLSIEGLLKKLYPKEKIIGQHRALTDVKFMIKIFLQSSLKKIFNEISIATYKSRNEAFHAKHTSKEETELLNNNLPKDLAKVTHNMTLKRLLRNGITYSQLQNLFKSAVSFLDFFDNLNDLGIDRKAAKSIATRLTGMGLSCSGTICQDTRNEIGEGDNDALDHNNVNSNLDNEGHPEEEKAHISRSDSGYSSNTTDADDHDNLVKFYNMYVDEFFYAPDVYEYLFGSFTIVEIDGMDNYIADLFDSRYPEYYDDLEYKGPTCEDKPKSELDTFYNHISEMQARKIEQTKTRAAERNKEANIPESEEKWDEQTGDYEEFVLATDHGRLGKVVPIGMTMDDFNGECFSGKVPLFQHFESIDLTSRPKGGIPKMPGKAGAKERNRLKRENKKLQRDLDYSAINGGAHTVVKSKSGEVFILV